MSSTPPTTLDCKLDVTGVSAPSLGSAAALTVLSLGAGVQSELAWAAGFFDGEGNTRLEQSSDKRRRYLRISIGQTEKETLLRFQRAVGGIGKIYGPYQKGIRQPIWTYSARGNDAKGALNLILPFCSSPKRNQAQEAINGEQYGDGLDHCKRKTHCPSGHPYDAINTYFHRGFRYCKTCQRMRDTIRNQ